MAGAIGVVVAEELGCGVAVAGGGGAPYSAAARDGGLGQPVTRAAPKATPKKPAAERLLVLQKGQATSVERTWRWQLGQGTSGGIGNLLSFLA